MRIYMHSYVLVHARRDLACSACRHSTTGWGWDAVRHRRGEIHGISLLRHFQECDRRERMEKMGAWCRGWVGLEGIQSTQAGGGRGGYPEYTSSAFRNKGSPDVCSFVRPEIYLGYKLQKK